MRRISLVFWLSFTCFLISTVLCRPSKNDDNDVSVVDVFSRQSQLPRNDYFMKRLSNIDLVDSSNTLQPINNSDIAVYSVLVDDNKANRLPVDSDVTKLVSASNVSDNIEDFLNLTVTDKKLPGLMEINDVKDEDEASNWELADGRKIGKDTSMIPKLYRQMRSSVTRPGICCTRCGKKRCCNRCFRLTW